MESHNNHGGVAEIKRYLPVLSIVGLLFLTLAVRSLAAPPVRAQNPQQVITVTQTAALPIPATATEPPAAQQRVPDQPTAAPVAQPTLFNSYGGGPGMGMRGEAMGSSKMRGRDEKHGGRQSRKGMANNPGQNAAAVMSMMNDPLALLLGTTPQDVYWQVASGKSLAQLAAEKGISQQQLKDVILNGGSIWADPMLSVIYGHYLTSYELTGKHIQVACSQCHRNNAYENTPSACNDCHARDDVHQGKLGTDCAACHTTATWER
jgi:hypothetical protein